MGMSVELSEIAKDLSGACSVPSWRLAVDQQDHYEGATSQEGVDTRSLADHPLKHASPQTS